MNENGATLELYKRRDKRCRRRDEVIKHQLCNFCGTERSGGVGWGGVGAS